MTGFLEDFTPSSEGIAPRKNFFGEDEVLRAVDRPVPSTLANLRYSSGSESLGFFVPSGDGNFSKGYTSIVIHVEDIRHFVRANNVNLSVRLVNKITVCR